MRKEEKHNKVPKTKWISKIVLLLISICIIVFHSFFEDAGHSLYRWFSKKVHQASQGSKSKMKRNHHVKLIMIRKEAVHVGNTDKPNYPVAKDAGLIEYEYIFSLRQQPKKADLVVESYDVDTIGGKIFINGHHIGNFSISDLWHTDIFHVPIKVFKIGANVIKVKTNILKTGKMEDFLFRNLKLFVEY